MFVKGGKRYSKSILLGKNGPVPKEYKPYN